MKRNVSTWRFAAREAEREHVEIGLQHAANLSVSALHRHVAGAFVRARDDGCAGCGGGRGTGPLRMMWVGGAGFILEGHELKTVFTLVSWVCFDESGSVYLL